MVSIQIFYIAKNPLNQLVNILLINVIQFKSNHHKKYFA